MLNASEETVKEAEVDFSSFPQVKCPYCEEVFYGRVLKAKKGEIITCGNCGEKFKLV
jgi:transcription elongation factor Elf1